jgi:ABC-type Fe3+/spermidine/putrescine transport system ATPase subunit/ABC-type sulfate transport system permease component
MKAGRAAPRTPRAVPLLAGLLAIYLVAPFVAGLGQVGLADWGGVDIGSLAQAGLVSVASATAATALVALGGIPLGYLLARTPEWGMALLGFVVQLPLALPPLASGILLLFLLGYASPLGRLTGGALTDSFAGVVLAEAFVAAPFLIIAARSAFAAIDPALEDVAATLGLPPSAVFRRVSLALASPVIWAGLLLTWLRAFGEFGATVMVAYHPYSLPVYTYVAFGSQGLPAMLPILLPTLLVAALVMAASLRAGTRPTARHRQPAVPAALRSTPSARASLPAQPLAFAFQRRQDGFTLDVGWCTDARRLCILGASGSGKSATLRLIAGLDRAGHASLTFQGRDLSALPPHQRGIAYVPQHYALLPHLPVGQQIRFGAGCDLIAARHWTERLGLAGLQHRRPAELSLGQQQRVALARALSRRSSLLLLDEPFSALDAALRARLRDELLALQAEIDATTILVTHDPAEAMLLADELLLLEDGRVLQSGPAEAVFQRPASAYAARLLGAETVAAGYAVTPGEIDVGDVRLAVAGPPLGLGPVGWAVRPGSVRIGSGYPATLIEAGGIRAGQRRLAVRVGEAVLHVAADPGCPAELGPCRVSIDPGAIQVWSAIEGNDCKKAEGAG